MPSPRIVFLLLCCVGGAVSVVAFAPATSLMARRTEASSIRGKNPFNRSHPGSLKALWPLFSDVDLDLFSPLAASWTMFSTQPVHLGATPTNSIMDPIVEAEVLNDLSHVALDLTTLLGPTTVTLRLATVVGRLLSMASDYIPDHAMLPEEFIFQHVMLFIALSRMIQAALPILRTNSAKPTVRDCRCYHRIFRKAGISWLQYKTIATQAFDWVVVPPDAVLPTENLDKVPVLIWPYVGEIEVFSEGESVQTVTQKCRHLLGDLEFARQIGVVENDSTFAPTEARAGPAGATVLMIDTTKLLNLMRNDEQIADGLRSVICNGMQERIDQLLTNNIGR